MGFLSVKDKMLDFGELNLADGAAAFPNVLEIGKADVNQMSVGFMFESAPTGGTGVTFSVEVSDDNSSYTEVGSVAATVGETAFVAFPRETFKRYIRAKIKSVTGTFTGGTVTAAIDTYVGK